MRQPFGTEAVIENEAGGLDESHDGSTVPQGARTAAASVARSRPRVVDMGAKEYCSTKEAAQLLGLSLGTVQQMVESGVLEGWKTAGGHRRIRVSSVERFLARSVTGPASGGRRSHDRLAVIVAVEDSEARAFYEQVFEDGRLPLDLKLLSNGFDVLLEVGRNAPDLLMVDLSIGGVDGFEMIRRIRDSRVAGDMDIVAVSPVPRERVEQLGGLPADVSVYFKPAPLAELRGYLQALLARKSRMLSC